MATSLELAIAAIRSGRQEEGRQLLNLLIQQNPNNEMAWLWMSSVVSNDEQRARCLYHVLAINPNNAVARKGLEVLGIVVSDSRPVKVPRDSQPIQIPRPSPKLQTGALPALPEPQHRQIAHDSGERRPFRVDPQTIVEELPFTPITPPFSKPVPAAASPQGGRSPLAQTQQLQSPSEPMPPLQHDFGSQPPYQAPLIPTPATETGPLPNRTPDTRPNASQAGAQSYPEPSVSAPAYYAGQQPPGHANVTMGMPHQNYAPQPMPSVHSQATMGVPAHYYAQSGQMPPAEPGQIVHSNTTMGMPLPGYLQPQQPLMQSPAFHSGATMTMPAYNPMIDYRMASPGPPSKKQKAKRRDVEEEEEGINILAVIIFGSLSITALGGLGMLILLMFATG